jgi:hypothetical protein
MKPPWIQSILPPTAFISATTSKSLENPPTTNPISTPEGRGISTTWKDRGVSLSPIKEPDTNNTAYKTQAFAKKIREKSIGAGTEQAMGLLGELHEIKNISSLWD